MKKVIDEAVSGLNDAAKEKIEDAIKVAVKDAVEEKVKKEMKKLRRKIIRRIIITGAVAACGYYAYTRADDIKLLVSEKVKELPESFPAVIIKK